MENPHMTNTHDYPAKPALTTCNNNQSLHPEEHQRSHQRSHPYLSGNFAPVKHQFPLTPCSYTGTIPTELMGGQYVRNGGNPVSNDDLGRDAHWFDGDGMLTGVFFRRISKSDGDDDIRPEFVNRYVCTDVYLSAIATQPRTPILPSIATLANPLSSTLFLFYRILRTLCLVLISHLPGSKYTMRKISVANTAIVYHDGRALATCESGPPMRVMLPGLQTVGWFDGICAEGESRPSDSGGNEEQIGGTGLLRFFKQWTTAHPRVDPKTNELILYHSTIIPPYVHYSVLPANSPLSMQRTPTSCSSPSVITETNNQALSDECTKRLINAPIAGISSAKLMHDFGVSHKHTVILDLPIVLDPTQLLPSFSSLSSTFQFDIALAVQCESRLKTKQRRNNIITYSPSTPSRFGVFPRYRPDLIKWFETRRGCVVFHTANTWDEWEDGGVDDEVKLKERDEATVQRVKAVNMLVCRLTSTKILYTAGNIDADNNMEVPYRSSISISSRVLSPSKDQNKQSGRKLDEEEEQCRLYYYRFDMSTRSPSTFCSCPSKSSTYLLERCGQKQDCNGSICARNARKEEYIITHQFALSAIPFEFPAIRDDVAMEEARYIYGCSVSSPTDRPPSNRHDQAPTSNTIADHRTPVYSGSDEFATTLIDDCRTSKRDVQTGFNAALGRAVKIDRLVKVDVKRLIQKGKELIANGTLDESGTGCVDERNIEDILKGLEFPHLLSRRRELGMDISSEATTIEDENEEEDPIQIFQLPKGWYAQEAKFVPKENGTREDDGWLLTYVFDEGQLYESKCQPDTWNDCSTEPDPPAPATATSELWIIDARNMRDVVARVHLPQRVPYGLHGAWFDEEKITGQKPVRDLSRNVGGGGV